MELTAVMERFVLHWGEMGTRWGVNRSVAQVHALLYLSPAPLPAEAIARTLGIARSNVSTSLRELQSYGLVQVVHGFGDRRDHFAADTEPWSIFLKIVEERKKREIDPTLTMLRACTVEADEDAGLHPVTKQRIQAMMGFVDGLAGWYEQTRTLPRSAMERVVALGAGIARLLR